MTEVVIGTTTPPGGQDAPPAPPEGTSNTPPATFAQSDVDRIVADRLAREKAKYADYDEVKKRAEQWDSFVAESASEQEKALAAARKETEDATWVKARDEFGGRLVEASITAAATGRLAPSALTALLAGVDKGVFLDPKGEVDTTRVAAFIDGISPPPPDGPKPGVPGGFGQGVRASTVQPGLASGAAEYERRHSKGGEPPLIT